jgi:hypothetical protein
VDAAGEAAEAEWPAPASSGSAGARPVVCSLTFEHHVAASPPPTSLLQRGSRLVILAAAQGHSCLPYPDDIADGKGQPRTAWPPVDDALPTPGALLGTCEATEVVFSRASLAPLAEGLQAELTAAKDAAEVTALAAVASSIQEDAADDDS